MKYIRKKSIRLRRVTSRRLRTIRNQLQKLDLSHTVEINLIIVKIALKIGRRDE